jgi:branched-chain amino acid aminotransferase
MMTAEGDACVAIERLKPPAPEIYANGVKAVTTALERKSPRLKSTTFIGASDTERKRIAQEGIFEALLVKNGRILEGMTSNFFYVKDNALFTAGRDVLPGVTRRTVIRLARGRGVEVRFAPLKLDQLRAVSEAFITSSSRGVVPVVQIDDVRVGEGRRRAEPVEAVGPLTKRLMQAYREYVERKAERIW